ncbi:TonB-dependent siderophore receptor [Rubrivivax gelatinosus]|uniref:TonB-dependent siderophore receptor n=1 Tax=Rubrivivax gelatinosus TaxID=28068 RepID=UPI0019072940|nr:TonB-dependent siderophore receptor [Rubrivivax gelatinosus]MBK1615508.1 TonB-dependent siderophore receptor [Rubrivivax gelatinosus]
MKQTSGRRQRALALKAGAAGVAIQAAIAVLCGVVLVAAPPAAFAGEAGAPELRIAPGPLDEVLAQCAAAFGVQLAFDPALAAGRRSAGLQGRHTLDEAFERLLRGSGLELVPQGAGAYGLRAVPPALPDQPALPALKARAAAITDDRSEGAGYATPGRSAAATGLALTPRETPQAITVVTRQLMDDFRLDTLSAVLDQTPGVTVARQNDMTTFTVRGADVNLQTDGLRQARDGWGWNSHILYVNDDMAEIDRVEVLKGSSGLVNGDGYPGATVNLVRKRPTAEFQASAGVLAGSWDRYRADADLSGPLDADGRLRARLVASHEDAGAFRDRQKTRSSLVYGVAEFDLAPSTLLTAGLSWRQRELHAAGGTTPIQATTDDGTFVGLQPRSFNLGASWAGYEQETLNLFARLEHRFDGGWSARLQLAHESVDTPDARFGYLRGSDPVSVGLGRYQDVEARNKSVALDVQGPLELLGRRHELLLGAGASSSRTTLLRTGATVAGSMDYAAGGGAIAEPDWSAYTASDDLFSRHRRYAYGAARWNLADPVKLITGVRVTDYGQKDVTDIGWYNYRMTENGVTTPYAGVVVDVSRQVSLYASYASIFEAQSAKDADERTLPPREGLSYEVGAKGEFFAKRLIASAAFFWMKTDNEAEEVGLTPGGDSIYRAVSGARRHGYEFELAGAPAPGWQAQGSYVLNDSSLESAGSSPRHQFKLAGSHRWSGGVLDGLTLGAATRWQSTIAAGTEAVRLRQDAYWVWDLMARWEIDRRFSLSANVANVFDKKYFAGITDWGALHYTWGAPRSVNLGLNLRY